MTDEQILKRLAEIEGVNWNPVMNRRAYLGDREQTGGRLVTHDWNPLTRWEDLGPLIEKYQPCILPPVKDGGMWKVGWMFSAENGEHETLPHAICLAIIEANGGMGDE